MQSRIREAVHLPHMHDHKIEAEARLRLDATGYRNFNELGAALPLGGLFVQSSATNAPYTDHYFSSNHPSATGSLDAFLKNSRRVREWKPAADGVPIFHNVLVIMADVKMHDSHGVKYYTTEKEIEPVAATADQAQAVLVNRGYSPVLTVDRPADYINDIVASGMHDVHIRVIFEDISISSPQTRPIGEQFIRISITAASVPPVLDAYRKLTEFLGTDTAALIGKPMLLIGLDILRDRGGTPPDLLPAA